MVFCGYQGRAGVSLSSGMGQEEIWPDQAATPQGNWPPGARVLLGIPHGNT